MINPANCPHPDLLCNECQDFKNCGPPPDNRPISLWDEAPGEIKATTVLAEKPQSLDKENPPKSPGNGGTRRFKETTVLAENPHRKPRVKIPPGMSRSVAKAMGYL